MKLRDLKIIKWFKEKILDKQKLLYEGNNEKTEKDCGENFRDSFRENLANQTDIKTNKNIKSKTIEECFGEYMIEMLNRKERKQKTDSYTVLTRLGNKEEEIGNNLKNQNKLLKIIPDNFEVNKQFSKGDYENLAFIHIKNKNKETNDIDNMNCYKIYLSTKRRETANLAAEVLKRLEESKSIRYKLKFLAESKGTEETKRYNRNEKVVIYLPNDPVMKDRTIHMLEEIRRERPDLLPADKELPLIPKENGFACVKPGQRSFTINPDENSNETIHVRRKNLQ